MSHRNRKITHRELGFVKPFVLLKFCLFSMLMHTGCSVYRSEGRECLENQNTCSFDYEVSGASVTSEEIEASCYETEELPNAQPMGTDVFESLYLNAEGAFCRSLLLAGQLRCDWDFQSELEREENRERNFLLFRKALEFFRTKD